ncbi:MAG TPA: protein phosphatase CheZ [Alphaproteobacteria bacterium]
MSSRASRRQAVAVVQTVSGKHRRAADEQQLFAELENLARFIESAKRDIAALHPNEIRDKHLPTATDELDAIVAATAEATGSILDSAEKLSATAQGLDPAVGDQVIEQVTRIFEACTFQDITGQRITKVVKTLKQIDVKVGELVRAFGGTGRLGKGTAGGPKLKGEAALLNGPQLPEKGASQAEIDTYFE